MQQSNTKKDNSTHISVRANKETPTLKQDLVELAKKYGRRFNDYVVRILQKHVEDEKEHGKN